MTTWQEQRQKQTQQRGSGGHWTRWMWWATGTTIALMTSATIGAIAAWMLPSATKPITQPFVRSQNTESTGFNFQLSRPIHILILGVDKPDDGADRFSGRSDTIVVMRFDPAEGTASLLSIPRDTQVELPEVGLAKINQANYNGGPEAAIAAVQQVLGEVSIDRYVRISTQALQEWVDLVGGVEVFVPEPMSYTDRAGQLTIDLEAGWQVLNGAQAEQFSRYRQGGYGDIGRVQRQQELMKAMRSRLTNPAILPKLPEAMRMMRKHLDTNLSAAEIGALVQFSLNLGPDRLRQVMLPGQFSAEGDFDTSYWLVDAQKRDRVVSDYLDRPRQPVSERSSVEPGRSLPEDPSPDTLHIVVQNATSNPEVSQRLQAYLIEKGFDNVSLAENWQPPKSIPNYRQRQTQIIAQQGNLDGANRLHRVLGLGQVIPASTGDLDSDITIRIGEDWGKNAKLKMQNAN
jgi:polyisoprenyl-teichoic acid--peptidoglycan teichoic acid transferase